MCAELLESWMAKFSAIYTSGNSLLRQYIVNKRKVAVNNPIYPQRPAMYQSSA